MLWTALLQSNQHYEVFMMKQFRTLFGHTNYYSIIVILLFHWLLIWFRIQCKIPLIHFKSLSGLCYIFSLTPYCRPLRCLRPTLYGVYKLVLLFPSIVLHYLYILL